MSFRGFLFARYVHALSSIKEEHEKYNLKCPTKHVCCDLANPLAEGFYQMEFTRHISVTALGRLFFNTKQL